MKLSSRKLSHERRVELSMTSMIDVVFLLLIFFLLTLTFTVTERNLDPTMRVENRAASASADFQPLVVEIVASGGRYVYRIGSREVSTPRELQQVVEQFPNKRDGAFVRVGDDAPFLMAAAAIQACRDAQVPSVSYVPIIPHN